MMMKDLHNKPEAQEAIVNMVTEWYQWCIDNVKSHHGTTVLWSRIGKISSKSMAVQIRTKDSAGNEFNVYVTPQNWWVKKAMQGAAYRFSTKTMASIESYIQEEIEV